MKKCLLSAILCLFITANLYSQPKIAHYNNWLFGRGAGITFTTSDGNPKKLEIDDAYSSIEGFSSVSDDDGKLLYYIYPNIGMFGGHGSDAMIKDHLSNVLPNGKEIKTSSTVASSALFINSFTNPDIYYVITPGPPEGTQTQNPHNYGISYSVIDRSKGATGEVTVRNKQIYPNSSEKIAGVMNEVDNFCWVITHEWKTNAFKLIKIDENGLDETPKTVNIGMVHTSKDMIDVFARMSVSPTGTTIAMTMAHQDTNGTDEITGDVEIYDFEPRKGKITNVRSLRMKEPSYSVAFSPNGKLLYVRSKNRIIQYNLALCDIDSIISSRYIINTSPVEYYNAMERGPNGVIYCVRVDQLFIDGILNPDVVGEGCNYTENVLDIGGFCLIGLPTVISSYFTGVYDTCSLSYLAREYEVDLPDYACFGDKFEIIIKSDYEQEFEARVERVDPNPKSLGTFTSKDSSIIIETKNEYGASSWISHYTAFITTASGEHDTISFRINDKLCCGNTSNNGQFETISIGKDCKPILFKTDLEFHASEKGSCQQVFTKTGQIATSSKPQWHNNYFDREPKVAPYFLIGDPTPNVEQRAWYQNAATRVGEKYTFSAYVTNLEKKVRDGDKELKELSMWLGVKIKGVETILKRIDNIKYEDGWVEISDEFIANDNDAELSIWVLGSCPDPFNKCTSFGFGIDDITLIPSNEPELVIQSDTTICLGEPLQLDNSFTGEIVNLEWTPATGLSNPYILNPIANPTESTDYTITIIDKYNCPFTSNLSINVDTCIKKCVPCVSIYIEDDSVGLGEKFCVDGEFIPVCNEEETILDFSLYFEYNPTLMQIISASTDYQLIEKEGKSIIKMNFDDSSIIQKERNKFSLCFLALLGDNNLAELIAYTDEDIAKEICLNEASKTTITYESCTFPLRRVIFASVTSFVAEVKVDKIALMLSTEQQGEYKFVLLDGTGRIIKQESYTTTKDKYEYEEVAYFEINDISSGVYFVRMQTPEGKIVTQKILIVK
ncbi:MAG: hypothetical protein CVV25_11695 [Ignavibacteriae bacterium HGW-Ignavibacteriae-4]|nr:MAG: hypothetical protein CVV25_11695 [Ignavibacteriae bacterium HGW-Ignavibacteriae-4]